MTEVKKRKKIKGVKDLDKTLVIFFRQISHMFSSGIPLSRALITISKQFNDNKKFKSIIEGMLYELAGKGATLSGAMAVYPEIFPPVYIASVRAGEEGGFFGDILKKIADDIEKNNKLKQRFYSLITYPIFMVIVSIAALIVILKFVIPSFTPMLKSFGVKMPLTTKILLTILGAFNNPLMILAVIVILIVVYRIITTRRGREITENILLIMPVIGSAIRYMIFIRFCRTYALLYETGFPIIKSLPLIKGVLGSAYYAQAVDFIISDIKEGEFLSDSMERLHVFPKIMVSMFRTGEETGQMSKALNNLSRIYEVEFEDILEKSFALLEPTLLVIMGCVIGFIIISIFMPMYQIMIKL